MERTGLNGHKARAKQKALHNKKEKSNKPFKLDPCKTCGSRMVHTHE